MAGGRVFHRTVNGKQQKTWTAQWDAPPDQSGKRKQKMKSGFKTKSEAQAFLAAKQTEINSGTYIEPSKMTFGQYIDFWIETYVKNNVQDTTHKNYTYIIKFIKIGLGDFPMKDLTPFDIQGFIKKLQDDGKATSTILVYFKIIKQCLEQAVKTDLLIKNPTNKVKQPRIKDTPVQAATPEELNLILEAAKQSRYYIPIYLAAMTGMRRGELLGLRWKDVDFETGNLSVTQSVHYLDGTGIVFHHGAKTESGRRTIALSPETLRVLKKHKIKQSETKLSVGNSYIDHDLVFANDFGLPLNPRQFSKRFKRIVNKIGLEHLHVHCLRHTHASLLLAQGESPKLVQERLGHKDASITLNVYSHLLPNAQQAAASKLDNFIDQKFKS